MKSRIQLVCLLTPLTLSMPAGAQSNAPKSASDYPSKPVRLIVTFPSGGGTDVIARIISDPLSRRLGQPVIIDNRAGANGNIGLELAARAPADGYTLVITTVGTWAVNPSLYKLSFDVTKDFAPIMHITNSPGVLVVHPSMPVKSVSDLIALAKSQPGKLDYGSAGIGGFGHISAAIFTLMSGTQMTHIPFKGAGPAQTGLLAGEVHLLFNDAIATVPYLKSGRMRALAVTSIERMPILPTLPTIDEAGLKGFDNSSWMGMAAPAGTPVDIVSRLHREMVEVLKMPDTRKRIADVGAVIVGSTPEQFAQLLTAEIKKFARVVEQAKISIQ